MAVGSTFYIMFITWITLFSVSNTVRITNFKVPHSYTLNKDITSEPLILDCEYEIENKEKGFVLKWLFNNHSIYQWIPGVKGYALGFMKSKIDKGLITVQGSPGVIAINKPDWNMTGEYTCFVQTFESTDRKSARLQIIVPETDFILEAKLDARRDLNIICAVKNVFPEPVLSVIFHTKILDSVLTKLDQNPRGLYSATVRTKIPTEKLGSPSPVTCAFVLTGTNYTKRRETIFYGKASDVKRKWTTFGVVTPILIIMLSR